MSAIWSDAPTAEAEASELWMPDGSAADATSLFGEEEGELPVEPDLAAWGADDLIDDQLIAGGVASKLVFSWLGHPGVGGLGAIRRRIEGELPDETIAALSEATGVEL